MSTTFSERSEPGYFGRRGIAFLVMVLLHIVVIWAFVNGFAARAIKHVETIIEANTVEQVKPKDLPPPPPPQELKNQVQVQVIAPDINISVPADAPPPPITNTTTQVVAPAPISAPPRPSGPTVGLGKVTYAPDPNDYYPDQAKRNGEEGRPLVKLCTDLKGRVASTEIANSSGHGDLDEAALKYAKAIPIQTSAGGWQACGGLCFAASEVCD